VADEAMKMSEKSTVRINFVPFRSPFCSSLCTRTFESQLKVAQSTMEFVYLNRWQPKRPLARSSSWTAEF